MLPELFGVGIEDERLAAAADTHILLVVHDLAALDRAQLAPNLVEGAGGAGADEPVNTAVDGISVPLPRGALAAGLRVHFENGRGVAVHPAVTPRR